MRGFVPIVSVPIGEPCLLVYQSVKTFLCISANNTDIHRKFGGIAFDKMNLSRSQRRGWIFAISQIVFLQHLIKGFPCRFFDSPAIFKIFAFHNLKVVVQVYRQRSILYDEVPCAAPYKIEYCTDIIVLFQVVAKILHYLTA